MSITKDNGNLVAGAINDLEMELREQGANIEEALATQNAILSDLMSTATQLAAAIVMLMPTPKPTAKDLRYAGKEVADA